MTSSPDNAPHPLSTGLVLGRPGTRDRLVDWLRTRRAPHALIMRSRALRDRAFDAWLGIQTQAPNTQSRSPGAASIDGHHYEPTDYILLRRYFKPLQLAPDDVVYEIGCGMGRTACMFARRRIRKCVGIEIQPELAEQARWNARRLRGRRAEIEIHSLDAANADYSEGTVFWLNNPFGPQTLTRVLSLIRQTLQACPRTIRIAYVPPRFEWVFNTAGEGWLNCYHRQRSAGFSKFPISYWSNAAL